MNDYPLVPCDEIFAKIEDQLSSYTSNGLLDTGTFFAEIELVVNKLGIAAYDMVDAIITLEDYKVALPCNFYLLDSAWLCDKQPTYTSPIIQSNFIMYTQVTNEEISQKVCNSNNSVLDVVSNGVTVQSTACNNNNENVLNKQTIKEYIIPEGMSITWKNPVLMTLKNKKTAGNTNVCSKECKNLFARSPYEISINQQGFNKFLHSNLEKPIIYLKYYAYPEDPETRLPLIPDVPVIKRAIEYHLMHYFFYMTWLNSNDVNIERKVQSLRQDRDLYMQEAINYSKIPSFNKSIEMAKNSRRKWTAYEILNSQHF